MSRAASDGTGYIVQTKEAQEVRIDFVPPVVVPKHCMSIVEFENINPGWIAKVRVERVNGEVISRYLYKQCLTDTRIFILEKCHQGSGQLY